jgi:hypothetical protein
MRTRLLAVALAATCIALLFAALETRASASGSGDPRIAVLQKQVKLLQGQVKALQGEQRRAESYAFDTRDQVALSFTSQTCLAAQVADLFEGTWGVIDQIKPTFGTQTQVNDYGDCAQLIKPSVPRNPVAVPPSVNTTLVPLMSWLH